MTELLDIIETLRAYVIKTESLDSEQDDGDKPIEPVVQVTTDILKVSEEDELRLVYGIVLRPNVTDLQGHIYDEAEVRKAAHGYLIESRQHDNRHKELFKQSQVQLVESFIAPANMTLENGAEILKDDWVAVSHVDDDELWADIKKGNIRSFSIVGTGVVEEIE